MEEKFYIVKMKNISDESNRYLNYDNEREEFLFSSKSETYNFKTSFTKEFLKENGFGWVFDCEGIKLEEVDE